MRYLFVLDLKEKLRQFSEEVMARAKQEINNPQSSNITSEKSDQTEDLQEILDELRSEIAYLRAELKNHRKINQ